MADRRTVPLPQACDCSASQLATVAHADTCAAWTRPDDAPNTQAGGE